MNDEQALELADEWESRANEKMREVDTTASHYTGCTGSLCMGLKIAAKELRRQVNDD